MENYQNKRDSGVEKLASESLAAQLAKSTQSKNLLGDIRKETRRINNVLKTWKIEDITKLESKLQKDVDKFSKLKDKVQKKSEDEESKDEDFDIDLKRKPKEKTKEKEKPKEKTKEKEKPKESIKETSKQKSLIEGLKEKLPKFEAPKFEVPKLELPKIEVPRGVSDTLSKINRGGGKLLEGPAKGLTNISRVFAGVEIVGNIISGDKRSAIKNALQWGAAEAAGSTVTGLALAGAPETAGASLSGLALSGAAALGASSLTGAVFDYFFPEDKKETKNNKTPAKMAKGGVVTKPTLAIIGEGGEKEYIIPQSKLKKFVGSSYVNDQDSITKPARVILGVVNNFISQSGSSSGDIRRMVGGDILRMERIFGKEKFVLPIFTKGEGNFDKIISDSFKDLVKGRKTGGGLSSELVDSIGNLYDSLENFLTQLDQMPTGPGPDTTGLGDLPSAGQISGSQKEVEKQMFSYLTSSVGLTNFQAAGILGNALRESGYRTRAPEGGYMGMFQWDASRWARLNRWAASKGLDPYDNGTQLQYGLLEAQERGTLDKIKKATSAEEAGRLWYIEVEVAAERLNYSGSNSERINNAFARDVLNRQSGSTGTFVPKGITQTSSNQVQIAKDSVSRGVISSGFQTKESFRKHPHEGVDIPFPVGTPLSFSISGKIIKVGRTSSTEREANGGYGQYLDVQLKDGKIARLAHLSKIPDWIKENQVFNENQVIAFSGGEKGAPGSGRSGGPHLHLEQHIVRHGLEETVEGKVDPTKAGLFDLLRRGGILSKQYESNVSLQKVSTSTTTPSTIASAGVTGLINPAKGTITSKYGPRNGGFHYGVDIANDVGTPIVSPEDGEIVDPTGRNVDPTGYGNMVVIKGSKGYHILGHLSAIQVRIGDKVKSNQQVGLMGESGHTTGPHVHWEIRSLGYARGTTVDPLTLSPADSSGNPIAPSNPSVSTTPANLKATANRALNAVRSARMGLPRRRSGNLRASTYIQPIAYIMPNDTQPLPQNTQPTQISSAGVTGISPILFQTRGIG